MSFLNSREALSPRGIGKSVPRREDARLLTGNGRYAADFSLPGQAYAYLVRSPHAHAKIVGVGVVDDPASASEISRFGLGCPLRLAGVFDLQLTPHPGSVIGI